MLCLVKISLGEWAPNDLVDAGEDDMIERGEREQRLRQALLVSGVGNQALDVWAIELLYGLVDSLLG